MPPISYVNDVCYGVILLAWDISAYMYAGVMVFVDEAASIAAK